jgi:hypothetical protein
MSDIYQVDLKPLKKDNFFCVDIGYKLISINFPLLTSFLSLCPTQGHPTEVFGTHSNTYPTTWIKERFNQGLHSKCILILLHAPFFITHTFFSFRHQSQHQPLIECIANKDTLLAIV